MRNAARNPAKSHVTHLDSINEAPSEDECSLASTTIDEEGIGSNRKELNLSCTREEGKSKVQPGDGACRVNLAPIDEEMREESEPQEKGNASEPAQASVEAGVEPDNSRALVVVKSRGLSRWATGFNFPTLNSASVGVAAETTMSQPPPEKSLNEIC